MTWVKICGITNLEDAMTAVKAGADALGFVFYDKSPRRVSVDAAKQIIAQLPEQVENVGVFVNQFEGPICATADEAGLTAVQLHGTNEDSRTADLIRKNRKDLRILVGISMQQSSPEGSAVMWARDAIHAFLVDTGNSTMPGGTGKSFDWQAQEPNVSAIARLGRVVVAGGLLPTNVAKAMRILKPWGVDVSTGVEARPGKKDPEKVRAFVEAVRNADKIL